MMKPHLQWGFEQVRPPPKPRSSFSSFNTSFDKQKTCCVASYCFELFSPSQKYQLLVYHADSLFHDKEYRNAVSKYTMALQQKKALSKTSKVRPSTGNATSTPQSQCLPSEIEVKYKMAECYTMLKQDKDAIAILDGIPSRQRTPKVSYS
nr:anaphase-promoting complex subunit 7-like [Pogona vitticeps]